MLQLAHMLRAIVTSHAGTLGRRKLARLVQPMPLPRPATPLLHSTRLTQGTIGELQGQGKWHGMAARYALPGSCIRTVSHN